MTEQELRDKLDEALEAHRIRMSSAPSHMDYFEYERYMAVTGLEVDRLHLELRMIETPEMHEIEKEADHMTLNDFIECVNSGGFIDYDGSGNYATSTQESSISIYPSDVKAGKLRKDFTHVVWYNR